MAAEHPAIIWQRHIVAEHAVLAPNMLVAFEFATTDGAGACPVSLTPLTTTPEAFCGRPTLARAREAEPERHLSRRRAVT